MAKESDPTRLQAIVNLVQQVAAQKLRQATLTPALRAAREKIGARRRFVPKRINQPS